MNETFSQIKPVPEGCCWVFLSKRLQFLFQASKVTITQNHYFFWNTFYLPLHWLIHGHLKKRIEARWHQRYGNRASGKKGVVFPTFPLKSFFFLQDEQMQ